MASKIKVECPYCGNTEAWDNRDDKKTPTYPDFKCTTKECGAAAWFDKKDSSKLSWALKGSTDKKVTSFNSKEAPEQKTASKTAPSYSKEPAQYVSSKKEVAICYFAAWAKDLALASIESGVEKPSSKEEFVSLFKYFLNEVDTIVNGAPVVSSTTKYEPKVETEEEMSVDEPAPVKEKEKQVDDDFEDLSSLDFGTDF